MRWRSSTNFVLDRPRTPQPSTSAATRHQGQAMSRRRSLPSRTSSYCVSNGAKGARIRIIRSFEHALNLRLLGPVDQELT